MIEEEILSAAMRVCLRTDVGDVYGDVTAVMLSLSHVTMSRS